MKIMSAIFAAVLLVLLPGGGVNSFSPASGPTTFVRCRNGLQDRVLPCGHRRRQTPDIVSLDMAKTKPKTARMSQRWLPRKNILQDDIFSDDTDTEELEKQSVAFLATLINGKLKSDPGQLPPSASVISSDTSSSAPFTNDKEGSDKDAVESKAFQMAKGHFLDLTCAREGEQILEGLFTSKEAAEESNQDVIRGAIIALQSLLIMGTQVGVKGSPTQLEKMVAHLRRPEDFMWEQNNENIDVWNHDSTRRLKYNVEMTAGTQLLAALLRKRVPQGAFDLLVELGVWSLHEDLALLRSGFPTHFTVEEEQAAFTASLMTNDPDEILGLRKDLRHFKTYTIDSASTSEIDDGLSLEAIEKSDGTTSHRFWIHIADADHWAPRYSDVFKSSMRRGTSVYLPTGGRPMFPSIMSSTMSLKARYDSRALSLGVELLPDGSIDESSIVVVPSLIRVDYRLTYDEVDDMLAEGVGYNEEWELGAMLDAALKRRTHRIECGSNEGWIPNPIPQASVFVKADESAADQLSISINIEASHNSGLNQTGGAMLLTNPSGSDFVKPVSQSFLLVTEMMVLAGEAVGKWKIRCDEEQDQLAEDYDIPKLNNELVFPFRSQNPPDWKSREREAIVLDSLRERNEGGGYCYAWFARRFFHPAKIGNDPLPHHGMGLDCYVQWTSPIRRLSDLQVHSAIKRYLRRQRVNVLMKEGKELPADLRAGDLGCYLPEAKEDSIDDEGRIGEYILDPDQREEQIDYKANMGLVIAARPLQRKSQAYWTYEYVRRRIESSPDEVVFESMVLGCVDSDRDQYSIYVHELGLEHRYLSERGTLKLGQTIWLKVASVYPRMELLTFAMANRKQG